MTFDPRLWVLRNPQKALLIFLGITLLLLWGNIIVKKGAILFDDIIVQADDPVRRMDQYVKGKVSAGFEGREAIYFFLHRNISSSEDLRAVLDFTAAVKNRFGGSVASLAEVPEYRDTGETLLDDPYITQQEITRPDFSFAQWAERVRQNPGIFGLLIARDFSWTAVIRYLPPTYDEIEEFRKTVEFLEGRSIPVWEWFVKRDIYPQDLTIGVGGWTMGRGLIDQGLNVDMLMLVSLGVCFTLPIFWISLRSLRAALLCVVVVIAGGFLWTRGAMGLFGWRERVFSLLAYANVIVQGTSFALHKFSAWQESKEETRALRWHDARSVDGLIVTTAAIAVFGFATLWSFSLRPVQELGLTSAVGVLWVVVLAVFVLPAADLFMEKKQQTPLPGENLAGAVSRFDKLLAAIVTLCIRFCTWVTAKNRIWGALGLVVALFIVVAILFARGQIVSRTQPLEFIRGTLIEKEARLLNRPGNLGFEFLDLLVEPARGGDMYDPQFLPRVWAFQSALKRIPEARETSSILPVVQQIARESFKKPQPTTREEVESAFFLIESQLAAEIQRQLYYSGGLRVSVSYGIDDSVKLGQFCDQVLALAHQEFPDLKVSAFNTAPLYPRVDEYVRQGKVSNVFFSQIGIALICGLLIWWRTPRFDTWRLSPWRGGILMSVPLLFATAVIGLLMGVLDIPLDMSTAPIGALAINAATDFSLYLVMAYQRALTRANPHAALNHALTGEGRVILIDCCLNMLCFLPLLSSRFLPVQQMGWMMGAMLLACAIGTLVFMAAGLPACTIRKEQVT